MEDDTNAKLTQLSGRIVLDAVQGENLALLTTASGDGVPHSTWMATMAPTDDGGFVTLTSPTSRKISNVRENPSVEWLFSGSDYEYLVYLRGTAEVIEDPKTLKDYWKLMAEKDRAYFLDYCNAGIGFAIIRTQIQEAVVTIPKKKEFYDIDVAQFLERFSGNF